jgi:NADH-quinone oxidoreductase subunit J
MTALLAATSSGTTIPDLITFIICAAMVLVGGLGVVTSRNPVHAALFLVLTLFGIAVLFIEQQADFLAAVQVIVYAGAIVVLFLFVIMFLGVDRSENIEEEPLKLQRPLALLLVAVVVVGVLVLVSHAHWATGAHAATGSTSGKGSDVSKIGKSLFTTYLFAFEITAGLLVIAVVGAVVLARRPAHPTLDDEAGGDTGPDSEGGELEGTGGDLPAGRSSELGTPGGKPDGGDVAAVGEKNREGVAP